MKEKFQFKLSDELMKLSEDYGCIYTAELTNEKLVDYHLDDIQEGESYYKVSWNMPDTSSMIQYPVSIVEENISNGNWIEI